MHFFRLSFFLLLMAVLWATVNCAGLNSNCASMCAYQNPQESSCSCVYPIQTVLKIISTEVSPVQIVTPFLKGLATILNLDESQVQFQGVKGKEFTVWLVPLTGTKFSAAESSTLKSLLYNNTQVPGVSNYTVVSFQQLFPPPPPPPSPPASPPPHTSGAMNVSSPTNEGGSSKSRLLLMVLGSISAAFIVLLVIACLLFYTTCLKKSDDDLDDSKDDGFAYEDGLKPSSISLTRPMSTKYFSYDELHNASNGFDATMLLGEGGFGCVFKGKLKDGKAVAIKRLTVGGNQGDKEFLVEVEMLSRLHHRNLVKLIGYYAAPSSDPSNPSESKDQMLCYELVPNGSLETWLHGPKNAKKVLTWEVRMKIAIGAARGLSYLHEDSQPCVIHRDFKASNILLEKNFHAKVSDFGLAKPAPESQGGYISTRVMGTFGYVDPEYAMTGHLLVKSDVYSYGVVLLELLTGRKPVDMSRPPGQENLVTWARPLLKQPDCYKHLADPLLDNNFPPEDFADVAKIAAACVSQDPSQRPSMGEVVQSLQFVQKEEDYIDSSSDVLSYSNAPSGLNSFSMSAEDPDNWVPNVSKSAEVQNKGSPTPISITSSNMSSESGPLFKNHLPSIVDSSGKMDRRNHLSDFQAEDLQEGR